MLLSTTATAHSDESSEAETRNDVSRPGRTWSSANSIDTYRTIGMHNYTSDLEQTSMAVESRISPISRYRSQNDP